MTELSIIIVNWKSVAYLRECLTSIYKETVAIHFEVIIVDNASGDDCGAMLEAEFPNARFIAASENLGFARANNLGYACACGQFVLFLNPDTKVNGDSLSRMAAFLRDHPMVGAAGARLLNSDGSLQASCVQAFPTILNQALDCEFLRIRFPTWKLWGMQSLFDAGSTVARVEAISGACFMVRRSVFEQIGRFSEEYFMYSDDLDLSYKISKVGFEVVCLSSCEVIHHGGKSSAQQSSCFVDVLQRQSMEQFFRKTRGRLYSTAYRFSLICVALVRLTVAIALLPLTVLWRDERDYGATVRKWSGILRWAVGLESWVNMIGGRASV